MKKLFLNIYFLLFLGLVIRLIFIPAPGFEADIAYWKWWGEAAGKGPAYAVLNSSNNYPPFFIMFLGLIWKIYSFLSPLETAKNLYQTNTFIFLLVVKLPAILCDLISAYLIYSLLKTLIKNCTLKIINYKLFIPSLGAFLYLFNPVIIFDSAYWGQTDSIAAMLVLLALTALLNKKIWLTFIIATIALETKTQTVIFAPFFFLLTLRWFGFKKTVEGLTACGLTFLVINFPYISTNTLAPAIGRIMDSANYFPLASLNAYNFWWVLTKGNGFYVADTTLIGNAISYKSFGMLIFWTVYILLGIYLWLKTKIKDPKLSIINSEFLIQISLVFSAVSFAFYMLPTQIHERYIFPFFLFFTIFSAIKIFEYFKLKSQHANLLPVNLLLVTGYLLLITISIFLNLHLVLVLNYPQNGFPLITNLNNPSLYLQTTIFLSWINIILFLILLWFIFKEIPKKIFFTVISILIFIIIFQLLANFTKRQLIEISLTSLKPVSIEQGWGELQINKTVDKRLLSSTYVWYNKGLGTHANSKIVYNLNGEYEKFVTDAGVDTESAESGSVEFIIEGDGKRLYKSSVIRKWNWPQHIEVSVKNIKTLTLIVTDGGDGKNGDHADWLNPKLYK